MKFLITLFGSVVILCLFAAMIACIIELTHSLEQANDYCRELQKKLWDAGL